MFVQIGQELFTSIGHEMAKNGPLFRVAVFGNRPDWSLNDQPDRDARWIASDSADFQLANFLLGNGQKLSV